MATPTSGCPQPGAAAAETSGGSSTATIQGSGSATTSSCCASFKQRLPRRLARLISARSAAADRQVGVAPARQQQAGLRACRGRLSGPELVPAGAEPQLQRQQQVAATMAALVSLLQAQQQQHQQQTAGALPGTALPAAPPPFASLAQLLAAGQLAAHLHEPSFRPPPPSYSAAMQEQRMRMLMQERAVLQQLQLEHQLQRHARPAPADHAPTGAPPPAASPSLVRGGALAQGTPTDLAQTVSTGSAEPAARSSDRSGEPQTRAAAEQKERAGRESATPTCAQAGGSGTTVVSIGEASLGAFNTSQTCQRRPADEQDTRAATLRPNNEPTSGQGQTVAHATDEPAYL